MRFNLTRRSDKWLARKLAERRRPRKKVSKDKAASLPFCGVKVPGLWWIEGRDGLYELAPEVSSSLRLGYVECFSPKDSRIFWLKPVSNEQAAETLLRQAEENAAWLEKHGYSVDGEEIGIPF